jgi:hypothetical protein
MIRIALTEAAFEAIANTLPFGSTIYEAKASADGVRLVWLERPARSISCCDALLAPVEDGG